MAKWTKPYYGNSYLETKDNIFVAMCIYDKDIRVYAVDRASIRQFTPFFEKVFETTDIDEVKKYCEEIFWEHI